ncbi:MAG: 30S ribosome-binding factor RbfA [Chloroflexota bacterium]
MVSKTRQRRLADHLYKELSELLLYEVADPRLEGVFVTDVTVDRELSYADIYVSALEGSVRTKEILDGLEHARGYLRSELADRVEMRMFPLLRFHWDPTPERVERFERLFASLRGEYADDAGEGKKDE